MEEEKNFQDATTTVLQTLCLTFKSLRSHFSDAKLMDIQFYRGIKNITQRAFLVKFCISQRKTSKGYVPFAGQNAAPEMHEVLSSTYMM